MNYMNLTDIQNHLKQMSKFNLQVLQIYAILEVVKAIQELTKELKKK